MPQTDLTRDNLQAYRDETYLQHLEHQRLNPPLGTCLSADCCPECGAPRCVCGTALDNRIIVCDGKVVE